MIGCGSVLLFGQSIPLLHPRRKISGRCYYFDFVFFHEPRSKNPIGFVNSFVMTAQMVQIRTSVLFVIVQNERVAKLGSAPKQASNGEFCQKCGVALDLHCLPSGGDMKYMIVCALALFVLACSKPTESAELSYNQCYVKNEDPGMLTITDFCYSLDDMESWIHPVDSMAIAYGDSVCFDLILDKGTTIWIDMEGCDMNNQSYDYNAHTVTLDEKEALLGIFGQPSANTSFHILHHFYSPLSWDGD